MLLHKYYACAAQNRIICATMMQKYGFYTKKTNKTSIFFFNPKHLSPFLFCRANKKMYFCPYFVQPRGIRIRTMAYGRSRE